MNRILAILSVTLLASVFISCFEMDTQVFVKKDGSGTIQKTFRMSKKKLEGLKLLSELQDQQGKDEFEVDQKSTVIDGQTENTKESVTIKDKTKNLFNLYNEETIKRDAQTMGEGVAYISSKKISTDDFEGYVASYSFKDIQKLKMQLGFDNPVPMPGKENNLNNENSTGNEEKHYIRFKFDKLSKSKDSLLSIYLPQNTPDKSRKKVSESKKDTVKEENVKKESVDKVSTKEERAKALGFMKEMFGGLKVGFSVRFDGKIEKTNAAYSDSNSINLSSIDFDQIFANEDAMEKLMSANPADPKGVESMIKEIPGMKIETQKLITVQWK